MGGMTKAKEKRERGKMNVWRYPIFHRGDERVKEGIRKELAKKRHELVKGNGKGVGKRHQK